MIRNEVEQASIYTQREFLSNVREIEPNLEKRMLYGLPIEQQEIKTVNETYAKKILYRLR